jgi:hypothetical protein
MSIPATETESKLSWEEDLRKDEGCTCMVKISSSVVVSGSPIGEKYATDEDGSDSSGISGSLVTLSPVFKKSWRL